MEHKSIEEMRREIEAQMLRMKESLFTSKFTPDPDSYMNADIGGDWDAYAMGYKMAGDVLGHLVSISQGSKIRKVGLLS